MASSDGQMSQAEIEALLASMNAEPANDKPAATVASSITTPTAADSATAPGPGNPGGMMSQAEIEALLNSTMPPESSGASVAEPADSEQKAQLAAADPVAGDSDNGMSPEEMEAFLEALKKPREEIQEEEPEEKAPEPIAPTPAPAPASNPGGMMSQEEIAAMLAAMNPETAEEKAPAAEIPEEKEPEPIAPTPAPAPASNPGGMMSQEEIAAMLAAMNPETAEEKAPAEEVVEEKTPEPVAPTPAPAPASNPGGMMSQEEIAAMLAAMNPETAEEKAPATEEPEEKEPEPIAPTPAPAPASNPGGMMSQEEIAAMLAAMNPETAEEKAPATEEPEEKAPELVEPEPVAPAPVAVEASNPGGMMSQEEIESMMAALNSDLEEETQSMQVAPVDEVVAPAPDLAAAITTPEMEVASESVADTAVVGEDLSVPKKAFFLTALLAKMTGVFRRKPKQPPADMAVATEEPVAPRRGMMAKMKALLPFGKKAPAVVAEEPAEPIPEAGVSPEEFRRTIIYLVAALALLLPLAMGAGTYLGLTMGKTQPEVSQAQVMLARMGIGFYAEDFVKQAGRGDKDAVNLFIEAGMPPDTYRPADGFTPVMAAASYGKQDIVRVLIGKGANPNAKDKDGQTALMKAVAANQALTVRVLVQSGADPNIKDLKGRTAITIAKEKKDPKVIETLLDLGIKELEPIWQQIKPAERKAAPRASELPSSGQKTPPSASQGQAPPVNLPTVSGKSATEFGIYTGKVGFAEMGKTVDSLFSKYDKNSITFGEGSFAGKPRSVAAVYLPGRNSPSFNVNMLLYNQQKDRMIIGMQVFDERFRTESGVGVGSSLGDLRKGGGTVSIRYLDDMMVASAKENRIMYELDISMDTLPLDWLKGGDLASLPDNMRIRSVIVY